jgi:sulfide:quinone oxidoreductase
LDSEHQITVVAPNRNFTFYPALVRLAFGGCEADDIKFDLGAKLKSLGVQYVQGEALRVNSTFRRVEITGEYFSGSIGYDYLVIALGRRLATEKIPGFFEYSHHLLGTNAALKFGESVRSFQAGDIVVGSCPGARLPVPACETAFALARKFENEMREGAVRIKIIFPESLEDAFGGANLREQLEAAFERHGIEPFYNVRISELTPQEAVEKDGRSIKYDLLMLVPPFRGNAALRSLEAADEEGFVKVDEFMRVKGLEKTYAAGDIVAFSGPKLAHMAVRQAETAAANIISELKGEKPEKAYYHEIATIIDAGGADSIYLHYGIWDDTLYRLKKGKLWGWIKELHDRLWQAAHD